MTPPRLTFAVPFHRGAAYLRTAIESVLAQREGAWRLVVRDDGEGDEDVAALAAAYGDTRIFVVRNERHLGMVATWNRCLDDAPTDLVTLLHADDRVLPDYAGLVSELADAHPGAAAVFCDAAIIDTRGRRRFSTADAVKRFFVPRGRGPLVLRGEPALRAVMAGNFIMCPTLCFRRSILGARRFSEAWRQVQDLDLTARLLLDGETLVGARRVAYEYRRHPGAATTLQSDTRLRFDEEFRLFDQIAARAETAGWPEAARVARRKTIVKLHLAYRAARDLALLRPREAASTLAYLRAHR